jgi:multidrug efflux pump subunit AcrA (membrane-fusion protein)
MEGGQAFLFVADEGTVHRRSVRLGTAEDGKVEVLDGLADGEEVLLPGDKNLEEGQVVRTRLRSNGSRG